jgi:Recombination endonuclease VII
VTASNEKKKKRYAEDPEYREERLACSRASYHAHKEERRAYMRAYYLAHRDEIIARRRQERAAGIVKPKDPRVARASRLQRVYGISLAGYEALFARQGGACAICKRSGLPLCVDHCHVTGWVRGLLCRSCNTALGFLRDDPRVVTAAGAYLRAAARAARRRSSRHAARLAVQPRRTRAPGAL